MSEEKNSTQGNYAEERAGTTTGAAAAPAISPNTLTFWANKRLKEKHVTIEQGDTELRVVEFVAEDRLKVERLTGGYDFIALTEPMLADVMEQLI